MRLVEKEKYGAPRGTDETLSFEVVSMNTRPSQFVTENCVIILVSATYKKLHIGLS
jgi:hypothetical protein